MELLDLVEEWFKPHDWEVISGYSTGSRLLHHPIIYGEILIFKYFKYSPGFGLEFRGRNKNGWPVKFTNFFDLCDPKCFDKTSTFLDTIYESLYTT